MKYPADIPHANPTPREAFFNRRKFLEKLSVGLAVPAALQLGVRASGQDVLKIDIHRPDVFPAPRNSRYVLPEGLRSSLTPREAAASHNNFYEFIPGTGGPVYKYVDDFVVDPWKIEIGGLCNNPMTLDLDDLFSFPQEERLYHFRCVERWAMNVPWTGFPLRLLIERADPKSSARFVRFETAKVPSQMPGIKKDRSYPWPYHEALRMDEAMHELTLAVTGAYGDALPKQHGAPLRVIVPWKYGYKSPKSIVKIEFTEKQPRTFWQIQPHEFGFLSNVNPNIPHPRWSQERSVWLDTGERFPTPIFNGYDQYVAGLYPDEPREPQKPLKRGQTAR